jgi:hypothetical protein
MRVKINLTFEADLDMVPGWGHYALDWVDLVRHRLAAEGSHYNPSVTINSVESPREDPRLFVIMSPCGKLIWSNRDGFIPLTSVEFIEDAPYTVFTAEERLRFSLPIGGEWVELDRFSLRYRTDPN